MPARRLQIAVLALVACKGSGSDPQPVNDLKARYHDAVVLADNQPGPSAIAIDDTHIYWTHFGKPLIRRMLRTGGSVQTVYEADSELGGTWLALDKDGVYFSEAFNIRHVPKTGGDAALVGVVSQLPARFDADADAVYSAADSVMRQPLNGTPVMLGRTGELWDVAVDATHVYWLDRSGVYRVAKAGGDIQQLSRGMFRFGKLALSDTDVYWGDAVLESIFAVPKAGGPSRFIAHAWSIAARDLVPDGKRLWVMQSGGNLQVIDLEAHEIMTVAVALARGGSADHFIGFAVTPETIFVAAGGQSLVGTGPAVVDLTNPNAKLPQYTYDGAILKLPAALPAKAERTPVGDVSVALVYFSTGATEPQDPNNATRWLDEAGDAYNVKSGAVAIKIIANTAGIANELALQRAHKVEALIRDKIGATAKISIETETTKVVRGDVRILLDEPALLASFKP